MIQFNEVADRAIMPLDPAALPTGAIRADKKSDALARRRLTLQIADLLDRQLPG
jgi:hypothetical protein